MLQQAKISPQMQQWLDRLGSVIQEAQAALEPFKPEDLARRSGCQLDQQGKLCLKMLGRQYHVSTSDYAVRNAETGEIASNYTASLILSYLATADGTPSSGGWIGFRDLPNGMFYAQAFQGYSGGRLVRELTAGLPGFCQAAETLGGKPLDIGGAAYTFNVLPRVNVAIVYYEGDEDFPSQAQVLFEDNAAHYLSTDGMAILGSQVVSRILEVSSGDSSSRR